MNKRSIISRLCVLDNSIYELENTIKKLKEINNDLRRFDSYPVSRLKSERRFLCYGIVHLNLISELSSLKKSRKILDRMLLLKDFKRTVFKNKLYSKDMDYRDKVFLECVTCGCKYGNHAKDTLNCPIKKK